MRIARSTGRETAAERSRVDCRITLPADTGKNSLGSVNEAAREIRQYPLRWSLKEYFGLVHRGVLRPDDRVELLEGLIVAMSPQNPRHATGIRLAHLVLQRLLGERATVQVQLPLILGAHSAPEPDVAVVPGCALDYTETHPTTALLIVEIADCSLVQDRLTKAAIYARAGIPEYWIVNLVVDRIEIFRKPVRKRGRYARTAAACRGDRIELVAFPDMSVAVDDLLPPAK